MSDHEDIMVEGPERSGQRMRGFAKIGATIREIEYTDVDGTAYVEGDIILGPSAEIRRGTFVELARRMVHRATGIRGREGIRALVTAKFRSHMTDLRVLAQERGMATIEGAEEVDQVLNEVVDGASEELEGVVLTKSERLWPSGQIPYRVEPGFPTPLRITGAIAHWHAADTGIRLRPATAADRNLVVFVSHPEGSSSSVGMIGGAQKIYIYERAGQGTVIHEIGHSVGLWHEQSREDRDLYITINYANIPEKKRHNFAQQIHDGDDVGPYDFESIMHYPRDAFAIVKNIPTIQPRAPYAAYAAKMGQRTRLSEGDIAAVRFLYGYSPAAQNHQ